MRRDFIAVLTDKPRTGGNGKQHFKTNRRRSKLACQEGMGKVDQVLLESIQDNINPLNIRSVKHIHTGMVWDQLKESRLNDQYFKRFLQSQVGRSWNDVYSDICRKLRESPALTKRVSDLISWLVESDVQMIGGIPHSSGLFGTFPLLSYKFYINPDDGKLCKAPEYHSHYRNFDWSVDRIIDQSNPLTQYHRVNGIWYEYKLREMTEEERKTGTLNETNKRWDSILNCFVVDNPSYHLTEQLVQAKRGSNYYSVYSPYQACQFLFGGFYYPLSRRQLNKREIKRIVK
jgi:hypothetical protein